MVVLSFAIGLLAVSSLVSAQAVSCGVASKYGLNVNSGWSVGAVLTGLTNPRGITLDKAGHLLVVQKGVGVFGYTLDANGCVSSTKTIISNTALNHGVEVSPDGTTLFASSSNIVWAWTYTASTLTATNQRVIVTGMDNTDHVTRTVLNPLKSPNFLVVSRGSNDNLDLDSRNSAAGRAQIRVFDLRTVPSAGYTYATSGSILGYGLRNEVGMTEDAAGNILAVENSFDDAYRLVNGVQKDVHTDNPSEKLHILGNPQTPSGAWFGYPTCGLVWEPTAFTDKTFQPGDWFVQAPNTTINDAYCETNARKPALMLPPHTAPLDIKLGTDARAYVSFHGSWDRQPPTGYKVVAAAGSVSTTGAWSPSSPLTSRTGFVDVLWNSDTTKCPTSCFRPVGLVFNASGGLYVSSDASGEVFLLRQLGGTSTTTATTTTTPVSTTSKTSTTPSPTSTAALVPHWGQCGGQTWTGGTVCQSPWTCTYANAFYSQCL